MPRRKALGGLTDLEQQFVNTYFRSGCSIARTAEKMNHEYQACAQIILRRRVRDAIEKRHARMAMGANEVISRLAAQARCSLDEVIDEAGDFSIGRARETGAIHQVKKYKVKETTRTDKDGSTSVERNVEVEMENRQGALGLLARYHALLTDNIALRGIPSDERTLKALILAELQRVAGSLPPRAAKMLAELTPTAVRIMPEQFRPQWEAEKAAREAKAAASGISPEGEKPVAETPAPE